MSVRGNEGQCALVTGASAGIGLELARVLAANRFSLVLLARNRDKVQELARELKTSHATKVTIVAADLSEPAAPEAVFDSLKSAGVRVDLLVNNAGLLFEGPAGAIGLDDQLRLLQVNVVAMTALTRLFLAPMLERNHGRILNVASVAAFMPVPNLAVYAASKAYVLSFGEEHDDHGCEDRRTGGLPRLHGGKAGTCRGTCQRTGGPMDQVSAELALAGHRRGVRKGRAAELTSRTRLAMHGCMGHS